MVNVEKIISLIYLKKSLLIVDDKKHYISKQRDKTVLQ